MYSNLTGGTLAMLIKNGLVFGGFHQPLSGISFWGLSSEMVIQTVSTLGYLEVILNM